MPRPFFFLCDRCVLYGKTSHRSLRFAGEIVQEDSRKEIDHGWRIFCADGEELNQKKGIGPAWSRNQNRISLFAAAQQNQGNQS
jgi:hypothetical protein